jgi:hypothetical protein
MTMPPRRRGWFRNPEFAREQRAERAADQQYQKEHNGIPPRAEGILRRFPAGVPLLGAEIGVFRADLSKIWLQQRPLLTLYLVDIWGVNPRAEYASTNIPHATWTGFRWPKILKIARSQVAFAGERAKMIRLDSVAAAKTIADASLDFAFIDDDHSKLGCTRSITAWFRKVKHGGWIGGHDYNHPGRRFRFGVTEAVHEFFDPLKLPVELDLNTTWFVRIPQ